MNIVRKITAVCHFRLIEVLLILAICLLILQLSWPPVADWWRLPTPRSVGFDQFESSTIARDHLVYLPETYGDTGTWPLVVFLHGSGEQGNDRTKLRNLEVFQLKLPAIVIAPQCLPTCRWEPNDVTNLVKHVACRYKVDRDRIYLVGYSMGGYGVWETAAAHPDLFAALVPISGGGDPKDAMTLRNMPVWSFHGALDTVVPIGECEPMIEAIRGAGGRPKMTIVPGAGHEICRSVCARDDVWKWLFARKRSR